MTSESQHPGQEPDHAAPGAAGPAPRGVHGSRPSDQAPQYPGSGSPDMGWAPPPPTPAPSTDFPPDWAPAPDRGPASPPEWAPTPGANAASPPDWAPTPVRAGDPAATSGPPAGVADSPGWSGPLGWEPGVFPPGQAAGGASESTHEAIPAPAHREPGQHEFPPYGQAPPSVVEPSRHETTQRDYPAYQPGPAPGIVGSAAVPLPLQETRVPGATLAASPPTDFKPSPGAWPSTDRPYEPQAAEHAFAGLGGGPVEQANAGVQQRAWGPEGFVPSAHGEMPQASAAAAAAVAAPAVIPAPRTPGEPPTSGRVSVPQQTTPDPTGPSPAAAASAAVSASASVPMASRVTPPTDHPFRPGGTPAAQPRVYGRPIAPEPAGDGHPDQRATDSAPARAYGDPATHDHPPGGFGGRSTPPASSSARVAPPASAAMPTMPRPDEAARMPGAGFAPYADLIADGSAPPGAAITHYPTSPASGVARPALAAGLADNPAGPANAAPPSGPSPMSGLPGSAGSFAGPTWMPAEQRDHGRVDTFKPETEPQAEPPVPQVRNGRMLAAVLATAVLLLVVPLGIVWLLTRGGNPAFDPAVGACVKQEGTRAVSANCGESGAFTVVSKVDDAQKCADPSQPHIVIPAAGGGKRVLCLRPAAGG